MEAAISLKVSSRMVVADRIGRMALQLRRSLSSLSGLDERQCVSLEVEQLFSEIAVVAELTTSVFGSRVAEEFEPPAGAQCLFSGWIDSAKLLGTVTHAEDEDELGDISRWNQNQLPARPSNLLKCSYDYGESCN